MKTLDKSTVGKCQRVRYKELIALDNGTKLQVSILKDSISKQSYAEVYVLDDKKWNCLYSIEPVNMISTARPYQEVTAEEFEDRDVLVKMAIDLLT